MTEMNITKIKVLFVSEPNKIGGEIINLFTKSKWSHVGIIFDEEYLYEAVMPMVCISHLSKYNSYETEIVEVEIPNYNNAKLKAISMLGTPYGILTDCIAGGLFDLTGIKIPDGEFTLDCSKYASIVLRDGGLDVLNELPSDCITPKDLYNALKTQ